jgi:hypothetical protein
VEALSIFITHNRVVLKPLCRSAIDGKTGRATGSHIKVRRLHPRFQNVDAWNLSVADVDQLGRHRPADDVRFRMAASRLAVFRQPVPLDDEIVIGPVQQVPLTSRRAHLRAFDTRASVRNGSEEENASITAGVLSVDVDHEPRFHVQLAKMSVRSFCG